MSLTFAKEVGAIGIVLYAGLSPVLSSHVYCAGDGIYELIREDTYNKYITARIVKAKTKPRSICKKYVSAHIRATYVCAHLAEWH